MNTIKSLLAAILIIPAITNAQVGGNQVYRNHHQYGSYNVSSSGQNKVVSTDSTVTITASVLMNLRADAYQITVGLNQEALTVLECNSKINKRIEEVKKSLKAIGVEEEDLYVDFISQTKVYDFEVNKTSSEQIHKGFEIKKNIIFKIKDISRMDQIVELCSKQEVYDIIKVEYLNNDIDKTYETLLDEAMDVINKRKALYEKMSSSKFTGKYRVALNHFYSVYPKSQYQTYQAYESSNLSVYNNYSQSYIKKEERKNKTFFYEGLAHSNFDRIINSGDPQVGIQYVVKVSMVYEVKP